MFVVVFVSNSYFFIFVLMIVYKYGGYKKKAKVVLRHASLILKNKL